MIGKEIKVLDKNNLIIGKFYIKDETIENSNKKITAKLKIENFYCDKEEKIYYFEMVTDKFSLMFEVDEEKAEEIREWLVNEK